MKTCFIEKDAEASRATYLRATYLSDCNSCHTATYLFDKQTDKYTMGSRGSLPVALMRVKQADVSWATLCQNGPTSDVWVKLHTLTYPISLSSITSFTCNSAFRERASNPIPCGVKPSQRISESSSRPEFRSSRATMPVSRVPVPPLMNSLCSVEQ